MAEDSYPCDWCGRAIYQNGSQWFAVKGEERGYNALLCDANDENGLHEPPSRDRYPLIDKDAQEGT